MEYQVRLSQNAERDVDSILRWFGDQGAATAGERWFAQFLARLSRLESLPERCPIAIEGNDLGMEIRQFLVGKRHGRFRILFQVNGATVNILRVRHASRDWLSSGELGTD